MPRQLRTHRFPASARRSPTHGRCSSPARTGSNLKADASTLTLVFGDATETLPTLWLRADAFYLDGFAPAKNPELWTPAIFKALARLAGEDATFSTYTSAGDVKRALTQTGFEYRKVEGFGWKRAMLVGRFAPRWRVRRHEPPAPLAVQERHAVVIGAGLAGCAVIERLAARGWRVTSLERHAALARDASGNPAGVFHPLLSRDDGVASRITRAGFLYALQRWKALEQAGHRPLRGSEGLLQLAANDEEASMMAAALATFAYPQEYVTLLGRAEAERIAKFPLTQGGWLFPHGGWIDPATLCAAQCASAGERLERRFGVEAARVERVGDEWRVFDADGHELAHASVVIFANAHDAARVAGLQYAPTRSVRGQLTFLPAGSVPSLALPVIGDGYAVPLPDGVTLTGATFDIDDPERAVQTAGHIENLQRLAQMLPALASTLDAQHAASLPGRVAFRCVTSDRLPMIGALADEAAAIHELSAYAAHGRSICRARMACRRLCLRLARSRVGGIGRGTHRLPDRGRTVANRPGPRRGSRPRPFSTARLTPGNGLLTRAACSSHPGARQKVIHGLLWITRLIAGVTRVDEMWT